MQRALDELRWRLRSSQQEGPASPPPPPPPGFGGSEGVAAFQDDIRSWQQLLRSEGYPRDPSSASEMGD